MRYLSVCSGIEAATVAWHHLGWTPVAFSEIEPFPAAVLKHRFPHVPNYGDMTKFEEWPIEPGTVDLLVGGTPCQSFSVAGLRKGLEDPRGNLMLTYLAIAARLKPRWVVWENVPGVLSSNGGRDFGTFLGALGELGYGWCYRCLDAQYVRVGRWPRAVPQRRRRVFVVGRLLERGAGDWTAAAEALALREGLQRHLEAQSKKGKNSAPDAEGGARGGGIFTSHGVAPCLETTSNDYSRADGFTMVAQPTAYRWQNDALGLQQDDAVAALRASAGSSGFHEMNHPVIAQPVPFTKSKRAQSTTDDETWVEGQVNPTLSLFDQGDTRATTVAVAHAFYSTDGTHGVNQHPEVSPAVKVGSGLGIPSPPAVAFQLAGDRSDPTVSVSDAAFCLPANSMSDRGQAVAHSLRADGFDASEDGTGRGTPLVPVAPSLTATNDPSRSPQSSEVTQQVAAVHASTMTVRRLSARECERLQAFPDDWTLIPWRGKPAEQCPDGPRYKALGNSMACNCMAWIGERIAAVEARHD